MSRWNLVSIVSIILTALMIVLWFFIPGFPLLIFLFFPPLFFWGLRKEKPPAEAEPQLGQKPRFCHQCGKRLLEPFEFYCPRCGAPINEGGK